MPKTIQLIRSSIRDAWNMKSSLFPVILLIMIPASLLSIVLTTDQSLGGYVSLITLIMNIAVISTIVRLKGGAQKVNLASAYYQGTTRFVPFVLVLALLSLQLIPFLIGGLIYMSGSTGATIGLSVVETALLGGIWLLIATPSLRWITRSIFGLYLVLDASVRPVEAVRSSSRLVRGKSWKVFGRLLAAALFIFVILIIPSLALSSLPSTASLWSKVATAILQVLSSLILLPFAGVYGYNLLEALGGKSKAS